MQTPIGCPVSYRVPEGHQVGESGSIYHAQQRVFAGIITRTHAADKDETYDLTIFVPGGGVHAVEGVKHGDGAGEWLQIGDREHAAPPAPAE